ncbi:polysaccharide pyruvyl transferase CsaB [Rossellomorea vietnamensis]|uniref:Polysaccharide pyruvyl transferase CsaB n=1 Tax=Rossellomorea vietnamensis TaxID=218284 RepID=A0A5D4KFL6_9BACI|nr:polysaccharide pyruvyl transferase CsaB [Rossellomorea vietnamensis]TYR76002.1 polysaccharide pyruvyl transferase CsaB [Rossellomorea vietnamensis]
MHVVLSGYYGFDNVGDEAILFSIITALRESQPEIKISVLTNDPQHTSDTYNVNAVNRWKMKEVSQVIKSADGLISGGGSLLQDKTGMKSIPYYTGIMRIAYWHKTPVFIYAQGMGPINHSLSKWLVKRSLNKASQITVRDEDSKGLLDRIGVRKTISLVPDPVMGLEASTYRSEWLQSRSDLKSFISVSVRDWPTEVPFQEKVAKALDQISQEGNSIVFLPMHGEHDEAASQEVSQLMSAESFIAPYDASIQEKIAIIGQSRLLVGMRLHSLIFSAINYVPFVAISYDPKIDSFASICDQPVAGHVDENNWNEDHIVNAAKQLLEDENTSRQKLKELVHPQQQAARNTAQMAIEVFSS